MARNDKNGRQKFTRKTRRGQMVGQGNGRGAKEANKRSDQAGEIDGYDHSRIVDERWKSMAEQNLPSVMVNLSDKPDEFVAAPLRSDSKGVGYARVPTGRTWFLVLGVFGIALAGMVTRCNRSAQSSAAAIDVSDGGVSTAASVTANKLVPTTDILMATTQQVSGGKASSVPRLPGLLKGEVLEPRPMRAVHQRAGRNNRAKVVQLQNFLENPIIKKLVASAGTCKVPVCGNPDKPGRYGWQTQCRVWRLQSALNTGMPSHRIGVDGGFGQQTFMAVSQWAAANNIVLN